MTDITLTVQDYEAAVFGDRFRNILKLIDFLRDFDLTKLSELIAALKTVSETEDIAEKVKGGLNALRIIAEMTPTDVDDKVVAMIDSVLTDKLLDIIIRLVSGMLNENITMQDATLTATDRSTAAAAGIPWAFLVKIALQIVQILENLKIFAEDQNSIVPPTPIV